MIEKALSRLRSLFRRGGVEENLEDELRFHFDHHVGRSIRGGMSQQDAVREARLVFGGVEQVKEACRDERRLRWAEVLVHDARYGLRMLRKQPGFTAAAVLILALGIGANTAIFSVVDAALLKPLPFPEAGRLVVMTEYNAANQTGKTGAPYPDYRVWAARNRAFEQMAAYWNVSGDGMVFGGSSSAERLRFSIVTNSLFSMLGVTPEIGRGFAPGDENPGAPKIFLASDALWKRNMGGSRDAIGKTFRLDGESFTLAGILPPGFSFPQNCDIWVPLGVLTSRQLADRISHPFWALARLRPGTSVERSQVEMNVIAKQLAAAYPGTNANWTVRVTPLLDEFVGDIRQSLLVLSGAVFFILLIACASVANLVLARSETRQKEFAMRAALGAARGRLICQTLVESLLIALISTGLALVLGNWGLRLLATLTAGSGMSLEQFHLDGSMLGFAVALAVATTVLIGLSPALQFSGNRFEQALREGPRGGIGPRNQRLRNLLVVAEISITLLLLCGAGLMLGSFRQLRRVDPGFNPAHVITMRIALPEAQYARPQQPAQFLDRLLARVKTLPGVEAVGAVNRLPLTGEANWQSVSIADRPVVNWAHAPTVEHRNISAGYFRAMGIRLVHGAEFKEGDARQQAGAVIVNQRMADRFWPGADPIGRRITTIDERPRWREVIGVVANVKHFGLNAEDDSEMYTPYGWWSSMNLVVRAAPDPEKLIPVVRRAVAALDRSVPVYDAASMDMLISRSVAPQRLDLYLLACFAILALLLSAVGIHGLLAFVVNSRQREIGLRMALGASPSQILRLTIASGMRLVVAGLAIGAAGSWALLRLMKGLLFHVSATDPFIFAGMTAVLLLVAMAACWLPARRATHVDPMITLRFD